MSSMGYGRWRSTLTLNHLSMSHGTLLVDAPLDELHGETGGALELGRPERGGVSW
jgi:hypothetical protein